VLEEDLMYGERYEATREFRQGAFRRGADLGVQVTRSQFIRVLRNRHGIAVHLAQWATADGLPSDYWDARADAFAQVIEELEGVGRGNWWS
jgi:hypothetical protein